MAIEYTLATPPLTPSLEEELLTIATLVFGENDSSDSIWRLRNMPNLSVFTARDKDRLVGFKVGYALTQNRYYSWLGGVDPHYTGLGIAKQLMLEQHNWAADNVYKLIETEAAQNNHRMCRLNESAGFEPSGFRFDDNRPRIIFRKHLNNRHQEV